MSGYENEYFTLPTLNEDVRGELVVRELERRGGFLPADAQAIVNTPAIRALMDFSFGLPGPLATALSQMVRHEGLRELR